MYSKKLNFKYVHFLGIGGVSQSALAIILKSKGVFVSGSDRTESERTNKLRALGMDITINGVSDCIKRADVIVVSASIGDDDKELNF